MRDEKLYLQDIVDAITWIERFMDNVEEKDFLSNDLLQSAILFKLITVGEAAANISNNLKILYPQVEWKEIVGFRNFAVHVYFAVKWEIVWTTITEDTPVLKLQIQEILQNEFPDFELKT